MQVLWFIIKNLGEYKRLFYIVAIASVIDGVAVFYIPVNLAEFANNPLKPGGFGSTITSVVVLYVVALVASYIIRGRGEALTKNYANLIRLKYFRDLSGLSLGLLRKKHSVYMQSLVNKAADGLGSIIFALFWHLLPGVVLIVAFFAYMARTSFVLACVNLVLLTVFVTISSFLARKMVPIAAEQNRRNASLLSGYADFMANIATVAQLGIRPYAQTVLQERANKSNQQTDTLQRFHAQRWFLLHTLFGVAYIATISFLVWQIAKGNATVGLLVLFVSAYGMVRGLIEQLSENIKTFMEVRAYVQELDDVIGQSSNSMGRQSKTTWRQITLRNVIFQYDTTGDTTVIPEFSVTAKQKVCIEGKSGQGKSTFLGLLTNALQAKEGDRLVDTVSYSQIDKAFFQNHVAVIAQEAELFHLSVRDNLTLGRNISDNTLLGYLDELELRDWFDSLDDGFDSIIGEKGVTLSAGQRQRLNILRGIVMNRSLYVLDEPTSHLDAHTEEIVVSFLRKHLANKAGVFVTHRPALRQICDTAYEMKAHRLVRVDGEKS